MAVAEMDEAPDMAGSEESDREEFHVAETAQGSGGAIIVGDRFHIATDSPLPELDSPSAHAFVCRDTADVNHSVFALVCDGQMPPRAEDLAAFRRIERDTMLRPIEWGVTDWPNTEFRRFVIIMDRPSGRRLMGPNDEEVKTYTEERLTRGVIQALLPVLKDLQESAIAHRSIRLDNMFYKDAVTGEIVLGEGFTAPPAAFQPPIYEPIDSAMCEEGGRGPGTVSDDLYSFGVVLAILLMGRNPMHGMSAEEVVTAKLRDGSYGAIMGDSRVSLTMMEPLRGLLADDRAERWTLSDLELWLNGRRLSPKQSRVHPRAQRPFRFENREYYSTPTLALGLYQHWAAATRVVANEPVDVWLRRGMEAEAMADAYIAAIRTAAAFGGRKGIEDRMVSRAITVLDPSGPLRYQHLCARISSFPTLLLTRMMKGMDCRDIQDVVNAKLPAFWLDAQENQTPEHAVIRRDLDMMSFMLGRPGTGYGLERCLYEANQSAPCLSPLIDRYYIISVHGLLRALDETAKERAGKGEPMDRHIAAFIAARLKHPMDTHLQALGSERDVGAKRLAAIRMLAEVQQFTNEPTPPNLGQWVTRLVGPIVESYQNRPFRERLAREVKKIAEKGSLMDLVFALENTARREKDTEGFREAQQEYANAEFEIQRIEAGEMTKPEVIERKGQEVAAMAAGVIACFALMFILLINILVTTIE